MWRIIFTVKFTRLRTDGQRRISGDTTWAKRRRERQRVRQDVGLQENVLDFNFITDSIVFFTKSLTIWCL